MSNGFTRVMWLAMASGVVTGAARGQVHPPPYIPVVVGGPVGAGRDHECIPAWERAAAMEKVARFRARHAPYSGPGTDGPNLFVVAPYGATLFGDVGISNYVDLDPTTALLSWDCHHVTYDGHTGSDNTLRSFSEQLVGIPVIAALDGVVEATDDGHPDMNTSCENNPPANYVILDNGGGKETFYWHLRNGSVAVAPGQVVHAGQQIGLIGSSGCSAGPHLHFETHVNSGTVYEPFAGPCRAGASGWQNQPVPPAAVKMFDFGVTATDPATMPQPFPYRFPADAQISTSAPLIYYWTRVHEMPANSVFRFTFVKPDNTVLWVSDQYGFGNADLLGDSAWWFIWDIPEMRSTLGTWHVRVELNGVQAIDAPVDIVTTTTPGFNRAPLPITLGFEPAAPAVAAPVVCRVTSSLVLKDLDWDVMRYHWVWKRNGAVIRDVVTAGTADVIAGGITAAGDVVEVTATPNDGHVDGPPQTVRVAVGCYANCDASTSSPRLNVADFTCFLQRFASADGYANCDASTTAPVLNVADFTCFLQKFAAGCP